MTISQTLTAESIGALHNDLIVRYLKERPQPATAVTPAVMRSTIGLLTGYLIEAGFDRRAVIQAAREVEPELLRSNLYRRGTLRPPSDFVPILIEDVIERAGVSKELAEALRQASQRGTARSSSPTAVQADMNTMLSDSQAWPENEQLLIDIFLSVANASHDLWFGDSQLQRNITRDSQLIISDVTGALIGSVLGPLGSILGGVALSVAVSETT